MPSPLSQQPADVLRDLPRKTPLLQGRGQPAGEKEVCLSSRPDAAVLPGQRQGNQAAPGKVPGLIQFRHGFFSLAARERSIFALIRETWRRAYSASGAVTVPTGSP